MKKDWIKKLPPGEYDMHFLKEFTGLSSHTSIKKILLKNGAIFQSIPSEHSNFCKNIYTWPGFKPKNKDNKIEDDFLKKL